MNDLQLKNILKNLGLPTFNCSIKKHFIKNDVKCLGAFTRELQHDLYLYDTKDEILYKYPKTKLFKLILKPEDNMLTDRWAIPVELMKIIGKKENLPLGDIVETTTIRPRSQAQVLEDVKSNDEVPIEIEDVNMNQMTLRDYACIKLAVPESEKEWLNSIIRHSKTN